MSLQEEISNDIKTIDTQVQELLTTKIDKIEANKAIAKLLKAKAKLLKYVLRNKNH